MAVAGSLASPGNVMLALMYPQYFKEMKKSVISHLDTAELFAMVFLVVQ